jgi:uncharacterized protein YqjF (DUF2071 family)
MNVDMKVPPPDSAVAFDRARPRFRWSDAATLLQNFALVTFDVEPETLASRLRNRLTPEVRTLDDGRRRGFVSAVSFRGIDFRFRAAELVRLAFNQTNYRAYVLGPDGRRGVFFFETTLDSVFSAIPRRLWGMPWYPGRTTIEASWSGSTCRSYRHVCSGSRNSVDAEFTGTAAPIGRLDGFADATDAAAVLAHPLDGFFSHPDGRLGRYSVWHPRLSPTVATPIRANYGVFERLGLVAPGTTPHSVLVQPSVEFDVHLPPT